MRRNGRHEPPSRSLPQPETNRHLNTPPVLTPRISLFIGVLWVGYLAETGLRGGDAAEHLFESL
jgi:hypothetical protein